MKSVVIAAQADEPLDDVDVRRRAGELGDCPIERVSSGLRVEHAAVALVEHDRERPALEALSAKPGVMRSCPRGRVVHHPVPEQQLREPVTGAHQITAGVLACAHEITRGLVLRLGHTYRGYLAQPQQPRQPLGARRSVLTRSAAGRIRDGAATTQLIPAPAHARASTYPVGPASYTTRTGVGSVFNHATVSAGPAGTRSDRTSPLP